jgi:glycosyltransferase involved in cell wall biosynthesis
VQTSSGPAARAAAGAGSTEHGADSAQHGADSAGHGAGSGWIDEIARLDGRRVAIVNWRDPWHPDAGGAEQHAWELATGLSARGAQVRYVTSRPAGSRRRERRDGVQIARMGGRFTVYPRVLGWLLARRFTRQWRPDAVVDVQNGIPFFTPWAVPRGVPVLCVMHHVHDAQWGAHFPAWMARIGRILEGPVARRCYRRHACVAVSPSTVAAMRQRLNWPGPVYLIPNGVSVQPHPRRPRGSGAALVWVGRLVAHKRPGRLADIAERLRGSGATIDVVGQGPEAAPLAAEISRRGLGGVVRIRGFLPPGEKESLVASSSLHLSTSQGEGWGLCVLEAAALGVPTAGYDVDGLRDAVKHRKTGWLAGDGERIEDVVERALTELADPARRAEMAAACAAWAAEFDWDRAAGRFAALLGAAIRTGSAQGSRAGAWVVEYPDADAAGSEPGTRAGGSRPCVVAEGPVFDVLTGQAGGTVRVRPASETERLLGRTDRAAWL